MTAIKSLPITRHATLPAACRSARNFAAGVVPAIFMGDDGRYWLTHGTAAGTLRKAGYEQVSAFDWTE